MVYIEHSSLEQYHTVEIPTLCMFTHPSAPDILFNPYLPLISITAYFLRSLRES